MQQEISELSALVLGLWSDLRICEEHLDPKVSGFWDRAHVRFFFSMVEGVTYRMRQMLIAGAKSGKLTLTSAEQSILEEKRYEIDSKGHIKESDNFLRFLSGFRFTLDLFCRSYGLEKKLADAIGDNRFKSFKLSIDIRDRLTHPKRAADMMVSGSESKTIQDSQRWFLSLMSEMLGTSFSAELPAEGE